MFFILPITQLQLLLLLLLAISNNAVIGNYYDYEDEDIEAPPGPFKHTKPLVTTKHEQIEYNKLLEQRMYDTYKQEYFSPYIPGAGSGGKTKVEQEQHPIHQTQIARPEFSTTGYYTGVTHFHHVNNKDLVTFLFSAGRHDGGSNTFFTIDTSIDGNPFMGVQELYIDEKDISTFTWVSSWSNNNATHYTLFSGGVGSGVVGPSKLYVFEGDLDGELILPPKLLWVENTSKVDGSARYCLLADLGNIYNDNGDGTTTQVSTDGFVDIIITGTGGLYIYSSPTAILDDNHNDNDWTLVRSILIDDLNDDTAALMGVEALDDRYLMVAARASWSNAGREFKAPSLVYDYQKDEIVQKLPGNGQTISVSLLDNDTHVLIGAGGEAGFTGQPNLLFDVTYEEYTKEFVIDMIYNNEEDGKNDEDYEYKEEEEDEDFLLLQEWDQVNVQQFLEDILLFLIPRTATTKEKEEDEQADEVNRQEPRRLLRTSSDTMSFSYSYNAVIWDEESVDSQEQQSCSACSSGLSVDDGTPVDSTGTTCGTLLADAMNAKEGSAQCLAMIAVLSKCCPTKPPATPSQDVYTEDETQPNEGNMLVSLVLSETQLVDRMPLDYKIYYKVDSSPNQNYSPGKTRTRQVLSFTIDNNGSDGKADLVLEINSAQTCNIFYRTMVNETASKVFQLPGSEGVNTENESYYARAGDTLVVQDQVYIILAQYNGNNTVYSFSTDVF